MTEPDGRDLSLAGADLDGRQGELRPGDAVTPAPAHGPWPPPFLPAASSHVHLHTHQYCPGKKAREGGSERMGPDTKDSESS